MVPEAVSVESLVPGLRVPRQRILAVSAEAMRRIRRKKSHITIVMIGDRRMAQLHRRFLGIPGTTDVLTFDLSSSARSALEAEIYICVDQARRQARQYRVSLTEEMARLAAHGILHLAGYDDHTERCRSIMRRIEDDCLYQARKS